MWLLRHGIFAGGVLFRGPPPWPARGPPRTAGTEHRWRLEGLWNLVFLAVIVGGGFISQPLFLREGLMLAAAAASWFTTRKAVHEANNLISVRSSKWRFCFWEFLPR